MPKGENFYEVSVRKFMRWEFLMSFTTFEEAQDYVDHILKCQEKRRVNGDREFGQA
jgi:hypothetical protein